ncbi:MAG: hypothetical protein NVS9B12_14290 [Vulcanimicrobiaceae bacterium]
MKPDWPLPAFSMRPLATVLPAAAVVIGFGAIGASLLPHRTTAAWQPPDTAVEHVMLSRTLKIAPPQGRRALNASAQGATPNTLAQAPTSDIARPGAIAVRGGAIDTPGVAVAALARRQGGDLLSLNAQTAGELETSSNAHMQIRVPDNRFETTLGALAQIGTTESRAITAEDVSSQLVDSNARLRNLRRTEMDIRRLMDRSGSVSEVLEAQTQLSQVREQIETLAADVLALQTRIRFSTIDVSLEAQSPGVPLEAGARAQLAGAWHAAMHAVKLFTFALAAALLWLIAFTPYLAAAVAVFLIMRARAVAPKSP